jgi:hypothetical protein
LMLCSARFLGAFPDSETEVPKPVRATLARQIALQPDAPLSDYFGSRQRERHLASIQENYGFSDFLAAMPAFAWAVGSMRCVGAATTILVP